MKILWAGVALAIALAVGLVAHFVALSRDLKSFCEGLPNGMPISEVREQAEEHGYDPRMLPYAQMSIEPTGWHYAKPACKVIFNKDRTIEYHVWQD
jgi:hypothetical protein